MKETGTIHWLTPNAGATNSSGFTALPGGNCDGGGFADLGHYAYYWSASEGGPSGAWIRGLEYTADGVYRNYHNRGFGFSVRCLRN
jgi:uncharacterized protein (TIGR02145 family)